MVAVLCSVRDNWKCDFSLEITTNIIFVVIKLNISILEEIDLERELMGKLARVKLQ